MLKIEALKYTTKKDFKESKAYSIAHKRGLLDDICNHMRKKCQN